MDCNWSETIVSLSSLGHTKQYILETRDFFTSGVITKYLYN